MENELEVQLVTLGRGTVNDAMLDSFGLESHEKAVLFSFVTREKWRELQKGMHKKLQIDLPGTGVAFLLPVGSIDEDTAAEVIPEKDATALVYCRSGVRSRAAAEQLAALGYQQVYDFGGIIDWPYETVRGEE